MRRSKRRSRRASSIRSRPSSPRILPGSTISRATPKAPSGRPDRRSNSIRISFPSRRYLSLGYDLQGKYNDALTELQRAVTSATKSTLVKSELGYAYARAGRREDALGVIDKLQRAGGGGLVSPFHFGLIHIGLAKTTARSICSRRPTTSAWSAWSGSAPIRASILYASTRDSTIS